MHKLTGYIDIERYITQEIIHKNPPQNENDTRQVMDNALSICIHETRCDVNGSLIATLEIVRDRGQQL